MRNILSSSIFYRLITAAAQWLDRQWEKSVVASLFLRERKSLTARTSIFSKLFDLLHGFFYAIFKALRLDRLLEGSIFTKSFFWCALALALAPLLETMMVLALVLMSFLSLFLSFSIDRDKKLASSPVNVFIYLYALVYMVCSFTSVSRAASLNVGLLTCVFVLFAIVLQNAVTTKKQTDVLIYLLVAAGAIVAIYGIYQYAFGADSNEAWLDQDMFDTFSTRVYSTLENPNVLAEYLLLIIPLAVAGVLSSKSQSGKIYSAIAAGIMVLCMLFTISRGGWLGLIFAMAVFLILADRRFIILGIIAAIAAALVMPDSIISRFTSIGNTSDGSTSYRLAIWMGTLAMLKDYWFCGIGPGPSAFNMVYPSYSYNAATAQHSHNLYLQIVCDAGVVGIIMFIALLFVFFKTTCGALARTADRKTRLRLIAVISGMFGFLLQGMTDFSFYNYRVMLLFWVYIALGMILSRKSSAPEKSVGATGQEGTI